MSSLNVYKNVKMSMIFIIIALGLIYTHCSLGPKAYFAFNFYIVVTLFYMIFRKYAVSSDEVKYYGLYNYSVSVIIVAEGEDSNPLIRTIKSLLNQEYPLKEIIIINRNSRNLNIYNISKSIRKQVELFEECGIEGEIDLGDIKNCPNIIIKRLLNRESREFASVWGLTRSTGDIILTCEPNSIIDTDEVKELIKHFKDLSVSVVTSEDKIKNTMYYNFLKLLSKKEDISIYEDFKIPSEFVRCYRRKTILDDLKKCRE